MFFFPFWWRSTSHSTKLTVSHPSIPTVPMRKIHSTWCGVRGLFLHPHSCSSSGSNGRTCLDSLGQHLASHKTPSPTPVFHTHYFLMSHFTHLPYVIFTRAGRNHNLLSITFSRIWRAGKLSRWPPDSAVAKLAFTMSPRSVLSHHLPGAAGHFPFDFCTVALICQAEK